MMIDIPYTTVETETCVPRMKEHAHRRHRSKSPKTQKNEMLEKAANGSAVGSVVSSASHKVMRHGRQIDNEAPPPYSQLYEPQQQVLHPPIQPTYGVRGVDSSQVPYGVNYAQQSQLYSEQHNSYQHGPEQYRPSQMNIHSQNVDGRGMKAAVSVQRNETYSAPIVKTSAKTVHITAGQQYPQYTMSGQSMYNGNQQNSGQSFHHHVREDSGLGIESNNSSAQGSPASYTQPKQHYSHNYTEQVTSKSSLGAPTYPHSYSSQFHNSKHSKSSLENNYYSRSSQFDSRSQLPSQYQGHTVDTGYYSKKTGAVNGGIRHVNSDIIPIGEKRTDL